MSNLVVWLPIEPAEACKGVTRTGGNQQVLLVEGCLHGSQTPQEKMKFQTLAVGPWGLLRPFPFVPWESQACPPPFPALILTHG